jgi:hypothetical protein
MTEPNDYDDECNAMLEEVNKLLADNPLFHNKPEQVAYALGEAIHNNIQNSELSDEEKGAIVSSLTSCLKDFYRDELILYYDGLRILREQKTGTIH